MGLSPSRGPNTHVVLTRASVGTTSSKLSLAAREARLYTTATLETPPIAGQEVQSQDRHAMRIAQARRRNTDPTAAMHTRSEAGMDDPRLVIDAWH